MFNALCTFSIETENTPHYPSIITFSFVRDSHQSCLVKKGVLKNFTNFLCWSLFLTNLWAFRPATLLKKIQNRCFPEKLAKFVRTPILKNICEQLLLFCIDLTNILKTFVVDFESLSDSKKVEILLYEDSRWDDNKNNSMLSAPIN